MIHEYIHEYILYTYLEGSFLAICIAIKYIFLNKLKAELKAERVTPTENGEGGQKNYLGTYFFLFLQRFLHFISGNKIYLLYILMN